MTTTFRTALISSIVLILSSAVLAQDTCNALVLEALNALEDNCANLGRNSACYGYTRVEATFSEDASEVVFAQPADRTELTHLQTLITAPLDEETGQWGVAMMSVQATNLDDTLPGQAVLFVMTGDAEIINAADEVEQVPMQSFVFTTGLGNPDCEEAPSRVVVQSPPDQTVNLMVNGVQVELSSTMVLNTVRDAEGDTGYELTMIEGEAVYNGEFVVTEGNWILIHDDPDNPVNPAMEDMSVEAALTIDRGEPLCRPTPDEDVAKFQAMIDGIPASVLNYEVGTIEFDERGCFAPEDTED